MKTVQEATKKRATMKRPALTAEQKRLVRELIVDEGNTRAEAVAWVVAFHPAPSPENRTTRADHTAALAACRRELAAGARDTLAALDRGHVSTPAEVREICEAIREYTVAAAL